MIQLAEPPVTSSGKWAKVIDHTRCIGCHACSTACKSENEVPLSVNRTYVKYVDVGLFPQTRRSFQVTRCNQCEDPPCVAACPTAAMYQRPDGIVDFDKAACIGCKACIAACPYDAIFINPSDHSAEKCNFCAHRIDMGLEPACVVVCPTQAIVVGDLHDSTSRVAEYVHRDAVTVRRPEKETHPKLFYKGAHQATLDPIAARRPDGGLFMWSEQLTGTMRVVSGHPGPHNTSAAAVLAYDVPHKAPWDWRVSLYTWTKGIAAGAYLIPALLVALNVLPVSSPLFQWAAPVLAGAFLAFTGVLLIWDLEHPLRFYYLFTRPQWRSWLVRGGFIIGGYSGVLVVHFAASVLGKPAWQTAMLVPGIPLALLTAVYTAYLFAQAKARDLWQDPLLPLHLAVHAALAGSAALLPVASFLGTPVESTLAWVVAGSALLHVLMLAGEATLTHPTASWEMHAGRYARYFWVGTLLTLAALAAPWLGWIAAVPALIGLLAHEHAYVQAGQSVPLA
jgi:Fe-S-cluster-containing dehydrogenase component